MPSNHDQDPSAAARISEPIPAADGPGGALDGVPMDQPAIEPVTTPTRTGGPGKLRAGLVGGAALALLVGAVATSLAASPAPSTSSATTGTGSGGYAIGANPAIGNLDDAFDHGRMGDRGFRDITIASISGSNVSLKTDDGWSRTIAVTSSVALTKGGQAVALSDLAVGDQVRIGQTRNADGTYTVDALAVVVPSVRGTVSDVSSSGFKVTNRDGSVWTITVNGATKVEFGSGTGSMADVTNGTDAVVLGETTGDNALTALTVRVAPDRAIGTVTSKTADTIVVTQRDGTSITVHVDSSTTYRVAGVTSAKLSDVAVDMAIGVSGRARADGSIDADVVMAGTGGMFRGDGPGGFGGGRGGHGGPGDDGFGPGFEPGFGPGMGGFGPDFGGPDDSAPTASPTTSS